MRRQLVLIGMTFMIATVHAADLAELQGAAATAITAEDFATAMNHVDAALAMEPENAYSNYLAALAFLESDGDLESAAEHLDVAAQAGAQPQAVSLLRARLYAQRNEAEQALAEIQSLADGGYVQFARVEGEKDFAALRDDPRFRAAVKQIRASRYPCEADPRHHAFDFWVGEWDVYQNQQYAGSNRIERILGDCLIFEQWDSASGLRGKSFNYYDPGEDHWRQIWVSDAGTIIEYSGEARDGGIYLTAETRVPDTEQVTFHRLEFTKNADGSVRQVWMTSSDQQEWSTVWDGHYVRRETSGD